MVSKILKSTIDINDIHQNIDQYHIFFNFRYHPALECLFTQSHIPHTLVYLQYHMIKHVATFGLYELCNLFQYKAGT